MVNSMTGYASFTGAAEGWGWLWEIRSVNGKGLDLRFRLSDGAEVLERQLREALQAVFKRGSITVSFKLAQQPQAASLDVNKDALGAVINAALEAGEAAKAAGLPLREVSAVELLSVRGVLGGESGEDAAPWLEAAKAQFPALLDALAQERGREGAALQSILEKQLAEVSGLCKHAATAAEARLDGVKAKITQRAEALMETKPDLDPERLEQELALIAVKADITEELDRLDVHVAQAQSLLTQTQPIGRKFDFLMQEFNREANTLCSKSSDPELTQTGLALKTLIDQMREQVQNIE